MAGDAGHVAVDETITPNLFVAATLLAMAPPIIVYLLLQKQIPSCASLRVPLKDNGAVARERMRKNMGAVIATWCLQILRCS